MRRSTKAAIVIVAVGGATIGLTTPGVEDDGPPDVAIDPVPGSAQVMSSSRGLVTLPLDLEAIGGRPFNPGGQQAAAATLGEASAVGAGESQPLGAESVIGVDSRTWLRNRGDSWPNAPIGRIDFRRHGVKYWCTGTLIDPDTVLTAGHCVHEGGTGAEDGWSTQVDFTPGAEGNSAPFGSCDATELLTLVDWFVVGSEYQDLGIVQLDCSIGETVGWYGYRSIANLRNVPVHVRGYPGDKVWSSLWTMRDRVRVAQRQMAFYQADTYGGQSGSPVFNFRPCNGVAGPCILAVHAYGTHGPAPHGTNNHGPRLNQSRVSLIAAVASDHG